MVWKRIKAAEGGGVLGHWEDNETCSMITLTKGVAHIVHRGQAKAFYTPAELYSDKVETIGKTIARKLNPKSVPE